MSVKIAGLKFIYFDLDDTLCTYWDASKAALRETFARNPQHGRHPDEMVEAWAEVFKNFYQEVKQGFWYDIYLKEGEKTRLEQMRRTLKHIGIDEESLARSLSDDYGALRLKNLRLFHNVVEVLEFLRPHFPMGLITNGPADVQTQEIAALGLEKYFDVVLIEGAMGRGKPHPEVFEHARQLAKAEPNQLLMVGNSYRHDVRPALEAGWHSIWVRRPSDIPPSAIGNYAKPEQRPEDSPAPTLEIENLSELLDVIVLPEGTAT
jgi:putative hydrolase of the HAD superfamily